MAHTRTPRNPGTRHYPDTAGVLAAVDRTTHSGHSWALSVLPRWHRPLLRIHLPRRRRRSEALLLVSSTHHRKFGRRCRRVKPTRNRAPLTRGPCRFTTVGQDFDPAVLPESDIKSLALIGSESCYSQYHRCAYPHPSSETPGHSYAGPFCRPSIQTAGSCRTPSQARPRAKTPNLGRYCQL